MIVYAVFREEDKGKRQPSLRELIEARKAGLTLEKIEPIGEIIEWRTTSGEQMWKGRSFLRPEGCLYFDREKAEQFIRNLAR